MDKPLMCHCCGRTPAKKRGEVKTAIGIVPVITCRWCQAGVTKHKKRLNKK